MVDFVVIICVICIMSPDDWAGVWLWRVSGGRRWSASGERSRRRASVQSVHRVKDRLLQSNPILEVGHVRQSVRRWRPDQSVKKTSPNSRKHRTSLPVSLPVLLNPAVHVLSSSSSTGSRLNTASTSK